MNGSAPRRLAVIVNPSAGGGRAGRALGAVTEALIARGVEHVVEPTRSLEHAVELALEAAADGRVAAAFGGDGLVGAVAGALRHSDGVLGVLPGGRGNDFARVLGIPADPVAAVDVLVTGGRPPGRPRRDPWADVRRDRQLRIRLGRQPDRK